MREYGSNINLPSLDNLFSSEQERQDAKLEKIQILPLTELHPFRNHPFQVRDDDEMDKMVDSIKEYGVMTPAIVRPRQDGGYEIVAGHRRCHASQRAGVETMPCIVRDMDDDTAIILMVDSNCQREHILPSEKAKAYEMKLAAIKRQGQRRDLTSGQMWVSKRDLTNDEELPGATLAIKDMDGNTVTTWVSTDEPHRVTGLHFGESYTLTEIRAADGYALADDITFRLIQKSDEDGNPLEECEVYYLTTKNILFWKWDDWKLLDDATVIMQDDITKVQISKKDLTTNEELPGAELIITDEKGSEIDRWISTDAPHYMEKLPAGKYTLTEVTAPDGYAIAERVEFEVLPTGEVQTFEMLDDTIKVKISKVDITTNEELPGAELVIKDKDGTEIDRWISTNEPHYVEKMPAGDYTLTEITAPSGYKVAESIDFTVLPTGEIQTVVMKDAREDTPTPTPDNTPTPNHTPQPTPNTTPAPAAPTAPPTPLLTIPKTGDNSPLGLLLAIAGISLVGLAILIYKSARSKELAPRTDEDNDTEE